MQYSMYSNPSYLLYSTPSRSRSQDLACIIGPSHSPGPSQLSPLPHYVRTRPKRGGVSYVEGVWGSCDVDGGGVGVVVSTCIAVVTYCSNTDRGGLCVSVRRAWIAWIYRMGWRACTTKASLLFWGCHGPGGVTKSDR